MDAALSRITHLAQHLSVEAPKEEDRSVGTQPARATMASVFTEVPQVRSVAGINGSIVQAAGWRGRVAGYALMP